MTTKTKRIWKGALAGLAGGFAGTFAMTQFQKLIKQNGSSGDEPATVKAARAIFPFPEKSKGTAGELLHYSFGTLNGALYGALAELSPFARAGAGALFGTALFVAADEGLVPLLGWSKAPASYPLSAHAYGLASHVVYGIATDGVRRALRATL